MIRTPETPTWSIYYEEFVLCIFYKHQSNPLKSVFQLYLRNHVDHVTFSSCSTTAPTSTEPDPQEVREREGAPTRCPPRENLDKRALGESSGTRTTSGDEDLRLETSGEEFT